MFPLNTGAESLNVDPVSVKDDPKDLSTDVFV